MGKTLMSFPIYIGSESKTEIAKLVLQHSIIKNTTKKVSFPELTSDDNWKKSNESKISPYVGTGFSLLRWKIPELMNFDGFAIYLDADILCLGDIYHLMRADVDYPNKNASHWMTFQKSKWFDYPTPESSVFLVDCLKARTNHKTMSEIVADLYNKGKDYYVKHMRALLHQVPPQRIPDTFNRLNDFVPEKTKLLHFTKEPEQPWYNPKHKHRDIWEDALVDAYKEGYVSKELIQQNLEIYRPHTKSERGQGLHPYWKKVLL